MVQGLLVALAGLAGPITARVLLALGMAVVTFSGLTTVISAFKTQILSNLGSVSGASLQLAGLAGTWIALGSLFGAITFAVTFWSLSKAVSITGAGS